jgi:hypothetical protein
MWWRHDAYGMAMDDGQFPTLTDKRFSDTAGHQIGMAVRGSVAWNK